METILQSLLELEGVNAAVLMDNHGQVLAQIGRPLYDAQLFEQVSGVLAKVLDSVQLQHEDWESITAQFADGKLVARNVGMIPDVGTCVLVIIADTTMNVPFATVAIRVAVNKLKRVGDPAARPSSPRYSASSPNVVSASQPPMPPPSARPPPASVRPPPPPSARPPPPAASGPRPMPPLAAPGQPDPAAAAMLVRASRELAKHLGPMARVFVDEAVRRVSPGQPFPLAATNALLEDLAAQIEDKQARASFLTTMRLPGKVL